jgi:hypothetical protein
MDEGRRWSVSFIYLHLDIYAYIIHCSAFDLLHLGITSYILRLKCVSRPEWSHSTWIMISLNDFVYISIPSVFNSANPLAILYHKPFRSFNWRYPHSIARFARNFVRTTDVGRNTKRKRKETSQQRSIYLVCHSILFYPSLEFINPSIFRAYFPRSGCVQMMEWSTMVGCWWIGKCS